MILSAVVMCVEYPKEIEDISGLAHFVSTVCYVHLVMDRLNMDAHSSTAANHLVAN